MRNLLTLAAFLLTFLPLHAQGDYEDLLVLYVDEDYEKCIAKAERYTERDQTRRDALPYLFLSMCYFEISKLDEYTSQPEWRKADRDALRHAKRYRRKDKELVYFNNFEDYWEDLNTMAMETGLMWFEEGDYSKARRRFDKMVDYYPENAGAWQMLALCQEKLRLRRDAEESMEEFRKAYAALGDIERLPKDQRRLLRTALIRYAEHMDTAGMRDSAQVVMELGQEAFMENAEFKGLYEELN
ncbi:MAG: tetratricopeptide repeat protein [Flavobacteriales bacterium]|nr:tetratricopeptide repeat protein [Flavobacteriales bacterium]HPF68610.1 tetratricopeptide repeat protein [Flavobacteriales bacterium]